MARYRIELATIVEVFANVDSKAGAQKFALDFITKNAIAGAPRPLGNHRYTWSG